jgi:CheY-like chemotaxis protein
MAPERRVLVVDDDPGIRRMVSLVLAGEGYDVRTAEDGRQALDLLASWHPAVILLDLMMPVMDGWTFLVAQQADPVLAPIPVIVMSASGDLGAFGPLALPQ